MNDFQRASRVLYDVFMAGYHYRPGGTPIEEFKSAKSQATLTTLHKLIELAEALGFEWRGGDAVFPEGETK